MNFIKTPTGNFLIVLLITLCPFLSSFSQPASLVQFSDGMKYGNGKYTSVALNSNNVAVEVHQSQNEKTLWYRVGKVDIFGITWGSSIKYDHGETPSVAIRDDGKVVEVHKSQNNDGLWYRIGTIEGESINWGKSQKYGEGKYPSITMNKNGQLVEVHKSQNNDGLWCHVGMLVGSKINWSKSQKYDTGKYPDIALKDDGTVVEVHQSQNEKTLWYRLGSIKGNRVDFNNSVKYDNGEKPSVAINGDGVVVETHKSQKQNTLWVSNGKLPQNTSGANKLKLTKAAKFDTGKEVDVAINNSFAIQMHKSEDEDVIWGSSSRLIDRANWMGNMPELMEKPLWQVTLPGSHDSGTYDMTTDEVPGELPGWLVASKKIPGVNSVLADLLKDWSKTQDEDILSQLNGGVRYFDLRPCYKDGDYYIHHGLIGPKFEDVLSQVKVFMKESRNELVVLNVSHFCEFNSTRHKKFIEILSAKLGAYLYSGKPTSLNETTIGSFVKGGSKILLVYRDDYIKKSPKKGFYRSLSIYDKYANTHVFKEMKADQLSKLKANAGDEKKLFLLSWTLTGNDQLIINDAWNRIKLILGSDSNSIHKLSVKANKKLAAFIKRYGKQYQINVIYVDFYGESKASDLAIYLNEIKNQDR